MLFIANILALETPNKELALHLQRFQQVYDALLHLNFVK